MRYRILGPLEVMDREERVELPAAKHRALLTLLLLRANEVVSLDRLIDDLWDGRPPKTAKHVIQVYVSELRKVLGAAAITTRQPGYVLAVGERDLDLDEFEGLAAEGRRALLEWRFDEAAQLLRSAGSMFRGTPLADFAFEAFAQAPIARLEELRLAVLEDRVEADLARGGHAEVVAELRSLVQQHPLREAFSRQLMLALYRGGRQAEALEAYQRTRRTLVDQLGIDPTPALNELERRILQHDPSLAWSPHAVSPSGPAAEISPARSVIVVVRDADDLGPALPLAEALSASPVRHEVVLVRLLSDAALLASASDELQTARAVLSERGVQARATAFTSVDQPRDLVRLATQQESDLLVLARSLDRGAFDETLLSVFDESPCDVAVLAGKPGPLVLGPSAPVVVLFSGADHDWAALELAAWIASGAGATVRLLGSQTSPSGAGRDASRLLATAALAVQQLAGVVTEPVLAAPEAHSVVAAASNASVVVLGCSPRWRNEGLGAFRASVEASVSCPAILVHRGLRPGGLSPRDSVTRFTWSMAGEVQGPVGGR